jgi:serine/threonine-protein kinase
MSLYLLAVVAKHSGEKPGPNGVHGPRPASGRRTRAAGARLRSVTSERERLRKSLWAKGIPAGAPAARTLPASAYEQSAERVDARGVAREQDIDAGAEFVQGELLGRGGMATVWSASQRALGREVAIKRASDAADGVAERLLLREAAIAGQLEHPNIVPIHQLLVDARGPAVVMKRISGKSWDALIEDPGVTLDQHLVVFLQTLNAVGFAHSRGVIHRDIKPQNVMIGSYGEVYLLDWGVAKRKQDAPSDEIVGTPCYMAPEMAEGLADERTDIFLLGATLHEVLVGTPRHAGEGALDVLYAAMYVEPFAYPHSVPAELAELCNRACARAPEARLQDVEALRRAVSLYRERVYMKRRPSRCGSVASIRMGSRSAWPGATASSRPTNFW